MEGLGIERIWIPVETWRGVVLKEGDGWRAWEEKEKLGVGDVVKMALEQVVWIELRTYPG